MFGELLFLLSFLGPQFNTYVENYAEAHTTLALPSGWQAQTKCVRFCESLRSLRETNYQLVLSGKICLFILENTNCTNTIRMVKIRAIRL